MAWLIGGFLLCPCHLPLTLGLAATLLAGTAAGAALRDHTVAAGILIAAAWVLATWRGLWLLRAARARGHADVAGSVTCSVVIRRGAHDSMTATGRA